MNHDKLSRDPTPRSEDLYVADEYEENNVSSYGEPPPSRERSKLQ